MSDSLFYSLGMATDLATRIRKHRQALGISQTQFAEMLGVTQATVSRWEKGSMPEAPMLARIAEQMGNTVKDLIGIDFNLLSHAGPRLFVKGAVAAGVWREALQWDQEDWTPYTGGSHIIAAEEDRFGLVVEGESMNQLYPPGTVLDCVSTLRSGTIPLSGQRVIVVRRKFTGEIEATVKEYIRDGEQEWLVPRSFNPAFQTPIDMSNPASDIEETAIIAIVRGAYRPE
jgi:transcriptional regulator with XRE-family HTH domain